MLSKRICFAAITIASLLGIWSRLQYEGPMKGNRLAIDNLGFTGFKFIMSWMITWPLILPVLTQNWLMVVYWVC